MSAITEMPTDSNDVIDDGSDGIETTDSKPETESDLKPNSKPEYDHLKKLVAMFKELNPQAKEFFPSYKKNLSSDDFVKPSGDENKNDGINRRVHFFYSVSDWILIEKFWFFLVVLLLLLNLLMNFDSK